MVLPMWAFWVALAAMIVGLLGVVLPVVPGVGFIWLVVLAYAIAEGFATIDPITFAVLTILAAIGYTAQWWMGHVGARAGGASPWSLLAGTIGGIIGALVGAIFLGVGLFPGAVVGALLGVFLAEWYRRKDWRDAARASGGWLAGCALSSGVQFITGVLMIAIFAWQALKG